MKRGSEVTKKDIAAFVQMYKNGESAWAISRQLTWAYNTVVRYLKSEGVFDPERDRRSIISGRTSQVAKRIIPLLPEIYEKYKKGERIIELSQQYAISKGYLGELLRQYGFILDPEIGEENRNSAGLGRSPYGVGPYQFIEAWQTSSSVDEVCTKLDMPYKVIYQRFWNYKKKGVKLKELGAPRGLDWDDLAQFADDILDED